MKNMRQNLEALNADLRNKRTRTYGYGFSKEDRRCSLNQVWLMQRPRSVMRCSATAAELEQQRRSREEEDEEERRMRKTGRVPTYKEKANRWARKSRKTQIMVIQLNGRLDSWEALKMKIH